MLDDQNKGGPNPDYPPVSRRNLFGGMALAMLLPQHLSAAQVADKLSSLDLSALHHLIRGLVLLSRLGDPVIDDDADALLDQIAMRVPAARLLASLYSAYLDRGPLGRWSDENGDQLGVLHEATQQARPVAFGYIDPEGRKTRRRALPLALVHPAHGVQLLAWCELRGDYRKFFVGAMSEIRPSGPTFGQTRIPLLRGLLDSKGIDADVVNC